MANETITFEIDKAEWDEFNNTFTSLVEYNADIAIQNARITKENEVEGVNKSLVKEKTQKDVEAINLKGFIDVTINRARNEAAQRARVNSDVTITVTD